MSRANDPIPTAAGQTGLPVVLDSRPTRAGSSFFIRHLRELSVAAVYASLLFVLARLGSTFYRNQFAATWITVAPVLVVAIGMTLVILARHIDISIGSQFSVCAVLAGILAKGGVPMPIVALAVVAAGAAMGMLNGGLVAFLGLPSIVVTLATMVILRESLRWWRQGQAVWGLPGTFQWFGTPQVTGKWILIGTALVVFVVFAIAMRWLAAGRAVYAVGSDQEAARLAGVRPRRVVFTVFVVMGALTGLASLMQAVRFPQVDPNVGTGLEMEVIAAVVVGGTAIAGGRGTLIGTLLGVPLLVTLGAALPFLGVEPYWDKAVHGSIILLAVASDALYRRPA